MVAKLFWVPALGTNKNILKNVDLIINKQNYDFNGELYPEHCPNKLKMPMFKHE